ncbi:MAG: LuxR family transcriptional regulator, maltose regulon positive regulatory protein, partial [Bradyrhizobium sp.]|nr:LuxR family transcriptional regulator, maltose regulon positive regulatory protein [Bradyrhizobium sp.]
MMTSTEQSFAVFSEEIGSIPARELDGMKHAGGSLSVRERMIVRLMGDGFSNKRIARQLSIAPETVKSHAKSIFDGPDSGPGCLSGGDIRPYLGT